MLILRRVKRLREAQEQAPLVVDLTTRPATTHETRTTLSLLGFGRNLFAFSLVFYCTVTLVNLAAGLLALGMSKVFGLGDAMAMA